MMAQAAPKCLHLLVSGQDEGSEPREQGMGQLLLAQSAASMRHLQESLHAERDAVQNSCHQRELERRSAKLILQEAAPFPSAV